MPADIVIIGTGLHAQPLPAEATQALHQADVNYEALDTVRVRITSKQALGALLADFSEAVGKCNLHLQRAEPGGAQGAWVIPAARRGA